MRKTHLLKVFLVTLFLASISCKKETEATTEVTSTFNLEEAKAAIETAGQTFVIAMNKGDSITLANC